MTIYRDKRFMVVGAVAGLMLVLLQEAYFDIPFPAGGLFGLLVGHGGAILLDRYPKPGGRS